MVHNAKRLFTQNKSHTICATARDEFNKRNDFYSRHIRNLKNQAVLMTENVIKVVYFLLKNDLSLRKFENIIELLDSCKTMIGNQLHSRQTARVIAMMIDEMFQKLFVNYLISDGCEEFSQIADELTDVGGLKVLLTKFRFFEDERDIRICFFNL